MEDIYAQIAATAPLGRLCTPEDVAAAVAFFVSSDGGYVTGKITQATGGTFHQNLGRK
jgi:3-oxoacyl-[acyl-carrier protein] reductase